MVVTNWFAESAVLSSVDCVKSALILRILTSISAALLLSVINFCFMEYSIWMSMMMIGGMMEVSLLKMMIIMMIKMKIIAESRTSSYIYTI